MGKRGAKPKGKVKIKWSPNFAYAIGLLATDGCISGNRRHIIFVSKDTDQIENFLRALNIKDIKIGETSSGYDRNASYRVQFGDVLFCEFLKTIGLTSAKSKTIGEIDIPSKYFFDFLRGSHDGDGTFYSYFDPRWKSSFMFYTVFISASKKHIDWIRKEIDDRLNIKGHITQDPKKSTYQLKYAKKESLKLLPKMYYNSKLLCLSRKRDKIQKAILLDKNTRGW